jgi:hypothetical protein
MSKPSMTAMERYDRMNREAAHAILANPNSIPLQVTWARAFLRRVSDEQQPESEQRTFAFDGGTR